MYSNVLLTLIVAINYKIVSLPYYINYFNMNKRSPINKCGF